MKSGYPFENEVLQALKGVLPGDVKITRNFEFQCRNQDGSPTIRSVDFLCAISKPTQNIPHRSWTRGREETVEFLFLVDAKYSMDETFLFTPSGAAPGSFSFPFLIPVLLKAEIGDHVIIHRRDLVDLATVADAKLALGGRKVKEQSKERDSVASAALQIALGMTNVLTDLGAKLGSVSKTDSSYYRSAHVFVPIVVTNAPLLCMKAGVSRAEVEAATDDGAFFEEVDQVALEMPLIHDLVETWNSTKKLLGRSHNETLGWHKQGIEEGRILFCTLEGMKKAVAAMLAKLDALPTEPR